MRGWSAFLGSVVCLSLFPGCRDHGEASLKPDPVSAAWRADLRATDSLLASLEDRFRPGTAVDTATARSLFKAARLRYKRQEYLWDYEFPRVEARLNGPPLDEIERDCEHTLMPAEGFQVLEEHLFSDLSADPSNPSNPFSPAPSAEVTGVIQGIRTRLSDSTLVAASWSDSSVLDAVRLELIRLAFLGVTSFDSPAALHSLREARAALQGMSDALQARFGAATRARAELAQYLSLDSAARAYLDAHGDFAAFDRAVFLPAFMEPLYGSLAVLQDSLAVPFATEDRAYAASARTLFSPSGWDQRFFAPPFARHATSHQAGLGKRLVFDPILSGSGNRSCAACHQPERAFTDGLPKSLAVDGHSPVARNAPTLIHAAFQHGLFADLRAESLEDQARMVVHNPAEMGGDLDSAARRLNADPEYARRFLEAFANDSLQRDRDMPVTTLRIRRALAAYVRTLVSFQSPWDRFMRGDAQALAPAAVRGFNLFMGKANCAACHFAPLFNGERPPFYAKMDLEVLGVPGRVSASKKGGPRRAWPDGDSGRMVQDHAPQSLRAFKTPTLRNIEFTGPYMHNGVFATLEEVVDFYDHGGGIGMGLDVPNQTLSSDSLHLDAGEKRDLVAFMKSLSDTTGMIARPSSDGKSEGKPARYVAGRHRTGNASDY